MFVRLGRMKKEPLHKFPPSDHCLSSASAKLFVLLVFMAHSSGSLANNCSTECEECAPGTYATSACDCCDTRGHCPKPAGDDVGNTLCAPCIIGTFCREAGCPACLPCPPGTTTTEQQAQECTPCEAGFYKVALGPGPCMACSQGSYTLLKGSSDCTLCPAGFYCSCGYCGPLACPDDAICPIGSVQPTYCYKPFFVKYGYSCHMSDSAIGIVIGACLSTIIVVGILSARYYLKRRQQSQSPTEISSLVAESRRDPIYTGL